MKLTLPRNTLIKGLDAMARIVERRSSIPNYRCGFCAGSAAAAVFDRGQVLVARGGVGIFAEGAR